MAKTCWSIYNANDNNSIKIEYVKQTYPKTQYSAIIVNKIENLLNTVNIGKLKREKYDF